MTADGYFGNVTDKIIAVPKMFYWQMMNAGKVRQLGLDISANAEKRWGKGWTLSVTGSYSMLNATDRTKSNRYLLWTPDSLYSTPFGFNQFAATYPVAGLKL